MSLEPTPTEGDNRRPTLHELRHRRDQLRSLTGPWEQVPDVLALQLGSNRNAIYKNLFDARRKLHTSLAHAGYPVADEQGRTPYRRPLPAAAR